MKIYLANSLFSQADIKYNNFLAKEIRKLSGVELYVPQENSNINDKTKFANSQAILDGDIEKLEESDIIIAVLDGLAIDPGVAAEIGYAYAKHKKIYGLYTDTRTKGLEKDKINALAFLGENQFSYVNLFVVGMIKENGKLLDNVDDIVDEIQKELYNPIYKTNKKIKITNAEDYSLLMAEFLKKGYKSEDTVLDFFITNMFSNFGDKYTNDISDLYVKINHEKRTFIYEIRYKSVFN